MVILTLVQRPVPCLVSTYACVPPLPLTGGTTKPGRDTLPPWLSLPGFSANHTSQHIIDPPSDPRFIPSCPTLLHPTLNPEGQDYVSPPDELRNFWNGMITGENITHARPPLCPKRYGPHLTEVAVSHPVCYINWFGRRPSPRWERIKKKKKKKKKRDVMPADTSWRPSPLLTPGALGGVWCSTSQPTATQISPRLFFWQRGEEQRETWDTENTIVCGARIETTPPPIFGKIVRIRCYLCSGYILC